jgi:hypothetical protein
LLGLFLNPEDGGNFFPRKNQLILTGQHDGICQKIEFFIVTAVRTSIPTFSKLDAIITGRVVTREYIINLYLDVEK